MVLFRVVLPPDGVVLEKEMSWDDVRKYSGLLKKYGFYDSSSRRWIVYEDKLYLFPESLVEVLTEIFGDEAREKVFRSREKLRKLIEENRDRVALFLPKYSSDYEVYRILLSKYGRGKMVFVNTRDLVEHIVRKTGYQGFRDFVKKLLDQGIIDRSGYEKLLRVYEELGERLKPSLEIEYTASGFYRVKPVSDFRKFMNEIKDFINRYRSITYYEQRIDEEGRPTLRSRVLRFMKIDWDRGELYIKPILLPLLIDRVKDSYRIVLPEEVKRVLEPKEIDVEDKIVLRDYQWEALDKWLTNNKMGTIVLPTGAGKTIVGLKSIAVLRVPTLILVPTEVLGDQWREKIRKFLGIEAGKAYGGELSIKPVTVATYQTLYRYPERFMGRFSLVIADEGHRLPAKTFLEGVSYLLAPYRMVLTATPERDDQNHDVIYMLMGNVVYNTRIIDLVKRGYLAPIVVEKIPVSLTREEYQKYREIKEKMREVSGYKKAGLRSKLRSLVQQSKGKVEKALEIIGKHLRGNDKVIVFTNYVKQAEELLKRIREKYGDIAGLLKGGMGKEGDRVKKLFEQGRYRVLIVTQVGDEGIDIPDANVALFLSYYTTKRQLIQRIGRVVRPGEEKISKVYLVYVDPEESDRIRDMWRIIRELYSLDEMQEYIRRLLERRREKEKKRRLLENIPEEIKRILHKTPKQLTPEEKQLLIKYVMSIRGSYSFLQDVARSSKTRARYVYTWLKNPSRRDIPGIDEPTARKVARRIKRILKQKQLEKQLMKIKN